MKMVFFSSSDSPRDYSGSDFSNSNLSRATFNNAILNNVDFSGATLDTTLFTCAFFNENTKFAGANVSGTSFTQVGFTPEALAKINQVYRSLQYTTPGFTRQMFESTANFTTTKDLTSTRLIMANMNSWNFSGLTCTNADFSSSLLNGVNFTNANLAGANLYYTYSNGANLSGASFNGTNLTSADLRGATVSGLNGATIQNTILSDGTIGNADFAGVANTLRVLNYAGAGESIAAKLTSSAEMSGGANLILEENSRFTITSTGSLNVGNDSALVFAVADTPDTAIITVEDGGSITIAENAQIVVSFEDEYLANNKIVLMQWVDTSSIVGLDYIIENGTYEYMGESSPLEYKYVIDGNTLKLVSVVPEPATYALIFSSSIGILALIRKRRIYR